MKALERDIVVKLADQSRRFVVMEECTEGYRCLPVDSDGEIIYNSGDYYFDAYDVVFECQLNQNNNEK